MSDSSSSLFENCSGGDALGAPSWFRCTFETLAPAAIVDVAGLADEVYNDLRGGAIEYLTPINTNPVAPGDHVFTYDVQIFPSGAQVTCAELARALNKLRIASVLRLLKRIEQSDAIGADAETSRAEDTSAEQQASDDESITSKVARTAVKLLDMVGWLVLVVLVFVALYYGRRAYKEFK